MIKIVEYRNEHQPFFEKFNRAWIEKYFGMEEIDVHVLTQPEEHILHDGGFILMAYWNDEVAGTVALRELHHEFELTKMAVDEKFRGKGIGRVLMNACIEKAKSKGITRLILYSNRVLETAIQMYFNTGFKEIPLEGKGEYGRSDIKMELMLEERENATEARKSTEKKFSQKKY